MRDNITTGQISDRAATPSHGFRASGVPSPCETCQVKEKSLCHLLLGGNTTSQPATQVHATAARREVLLDAERAPDNINVVCDGWAFRFRRIRDGRRHILYFLLPGDVVYPLAGAPGFAIQALTDMRYCKFVHPEIKVRLREDPMLFDAWVADAVAERMRLAATSVALGQFSASERIAQLVVQLRDRLEARGLVHDRVVCLSLAPVPYCGCDRIDDRPREQNTECVPPGRCFRDRRWDSQNFQSDQTSSDRRRRRMSLRENYT